MADKYTSQIDEHLDRIQRIVTLNQQLNVPPIVERFPPVSWELSSLSHNTQMARWLCETERRQEEYKTRVAAAVQTMVHDQQVRKSSVELLQHDAELDQALQRWSNEIQRTAQEHNAKIQQNIVLAKRIVEFVRMFKSPLRDLPEGFLDTNHGTQVQEWIQSTVSERKDYETR